MTAELDIAFEMQASISYVRDYIIAFPKLSSAIVVMSFTAAFFQRDDMALWFACALGVMFLWLALKVMVLGCFHDRVFESERNHGLNFSMWIGSMILAALLVAPTLIKHADAV